MKNKDRLSAMNCSELLITLEKICRIPYTQIFLSSLILIRLFSYSFYFRERIVFSLLLENISYAHDCMRHIRKKISNKPDYARHIMHLKCSKCWLI